MSTGENETGLRSIMDLTRMISIAILLIHFYITCHVAFGSWHLTAAVVDGVMRNIAHQFVFRSIWTVKLSALLLQVVYLFGIQGKKDEKINLKTATAYAISGLLLYFLANLLLFVPGHAEPLALAYMGITTTGYLLMVTGGAYLSRILKVRLDKDIFNDENESFPQEERLLENDFSINIPGKYRLKNQVRNMWLNIINAARMCMVIGLPGAGKTYFVIRHVIQQAIEKRHFSALIYDFKYDDLAKIAYNSWLKAKHKYPVEPKFYIINFDDPIHRCNPLEPTSMRDITDATEASRTILLGLNPQWIQKVGDFFIESPINFLTAIIWYLRKYKDGKFCTLPHAVELMQIDYRELFPILASEAEIEALIGWRPLSGWAPPLPDKSLYYGLSQPGNGAARRTGRLCQDRTREVVISIAILCIRRQ